MGSSYAEERYRQRVVKGLRRRAKEFGYELTEVGAARGVSEESLGLLGERIELRYAFIADHQETWLVSVQCAALEVSRSGFYDYVSRQTQLTIDAEEVTLLARVQAISAQARESYGSRRMAKTLQAEGFAVGRVQARRLMKDAGESVKRQNTRKPQSPNSRHGYGVAPNGMYREIDVEKPNAVWAGDLTT